MAVLSDDKDESKNKLDKQVSEELTEFAEAAELTEEEKQFLELINANRKNNGLKELQIDNEIQNIARLKAKDLEENNYFSHVSEKYGNIDNMLKSFDVEYTSSAENIAGNMNLVGAVEAWMNSANHKSNILSEKYNYTGVAIVNSKTYGKIFVEVFVEK